MSGGWFSGMTAGASSVPGSRLADVDDNPNNKSPVPHQGAASSDGTAGISDFHQQGLAQAGAKTSPNQVESTIDDGIALYNSDAVQDGLTYGPIVTAAAYGAMSAAGTGTAGMVGAAMTAAAPVAATIGVAAVVGFVGFKGGEWVGHWSMNALGYERISDAGEMPATVGHPIAHVSGWSLGAMAVGALAAAAVIFTFGVAAVVIVAAVAVGSLAMGFASAAGQYGTNKGTIKTGSPNVYFRNKPVARVTDIVDCSEHAESKVAQGAETVFANNWPIARIGHKTTCDGTINDGIPDIAIDIDTSPIALPVDVGNESRAVSLLAIATDILPIGGRSDRPGTAAYGNSGNAPLGSRTGCNDPIDVATGQLLEFRTDISIPGTIPLRLDRVYAPQSFGIQGAHWAGTWAQHLRIERDAITFQNAEGTLIVFHAPDDEVLAYNLRFPHLELLGRRSADLFIHDRRARLFYVFADEGNGVRRLARIEDRNKNAITFRYGMDGLRRVDHSDGFSLQVHSENGLIRHAALDAADADECVFTWGYNRAGQLTEVRSSQTGFIAYQYDAQDRIVSWRDAKDTFVHYEYDEDDRICKTWSNSGHLGGTIDYDLARKRTAMRTETGAVTIWDWTADGTVWRTQDALGQVWQTEWDEAYHVIARVDPLGHRTAFTFDRHGNLIAQVDADGHEARWEYDLQGQMITAIDAAGHRTEFRYDENGNLVGSTDPLGRISSLGLGQKGEVLRIDLPGGVQQRIYYDPLLRPSRRRDPDGNEIRMGYDTEGRLHWFTDEVGATTRYDMMRGPDNPRGAIRQIETEDLAISTVTWDTEGQLSSITDPSGSTRYFRFGAFDLPLDTVDASGHRLRLEHDRELRLTAVINEMGQRYEYLYDAVGQVVAEKDYSGQVTRYTRDPAGRVIQRVAADGVRTNYAYSPAGRLLSQSVEKTTDQGETRFEYDPRGLLTKACNKVATVEYDYDAIGRIVSERLNGRQISSEYSVAGQRVARSGDVLNLTSGWTRAGLPVEMKIGNHAPLTFRHDPRGLEQMRQSQAGFTLAQGHNVMGTLAEQLAGAMAHMPDETRLGGFSTGLYQEYGTRTAVGVHRSYEWDRVGRAIAVNDHTAGQARFDYDLRGQVITTRVDRPDGRSVLSHFEYDPARNIAAVIQSGREQVVDTSAGRVRRRGAVSYRHDACGRVIEKRVEENGFRPRVWRMAWDGLSQLVALETPEGEIWHYAYDPLGRRVARLLDGNGGVAYQWEGDRLIAEAPMTASGEVCWGNARHWVYEADSFRPLAQIENGILHYIVTDHLGTPRELFSEDGEQINWRAELSLWGEMAGHRRPKAANDDVPPISCPIRFQGQWHDPESGLHYNRFRYYDAEATQYLSPDPIGLEGGLRPQAYVADPNGWVDPLGLSCCPDVPGRVQSRINLANGSTRFTPLNQHGNPVASGWLHVEARHFGGNNNQSQFTLPQPEIRNILQSDRVVSSPIQEIKPINGVPTYVRTVDVGQTIGTVRHAHGGGPTSKMTIQTDQAGNLITAYPVP